MTIAGSDSGGGAGLQADLKTFAALGVFGTSVVTAVTAQNTAEVRAVVAIEPRMVDLQIEALLADLPIAAVKTGMLATKKTIERVARRAAGAELPNLVVDPVLVASTGRPLLDEDGVRAYRDLLVPYAYLLTPNLHEAAILTGAELADVDGIDAMARAALSLVGLGARNVVVKGGHAGGDRAPDVFVGSNAASSEGVVVLDSVRVDSANDHGSGCTLSAAVAALLARGYELHAALGQAKEYVRSAIEGASGWRLGAGHGPLDHFGWGRADAGGGQH